MAVTWAAFFNFVAFAILGTRVAKTIGGDLVRIELVTEDMRLYTLLAGLLGAIIWNLITWYVGLPTSSSHALIGGYGGAAIAAYGSFIGILKPEGWTKTIIFIAASPLIGMTLGFFTMVAVHWIFRRSSPHSVDRIFRKGQLVSAALYSLGHGGNDAQKTMGIITAVLVAGGLLASGPAANFPKFPLGSALGPRRDRARHVLRRLAHRAHDGFEDYETKTSRRLLCRNFRRHRIVRSNTGRDSGFHHSHNHRRDSRRRIHSPAFGSQMGSGAPHRLGLGAHDPHGRHDRRDLILHHPNHPSAFRLILSV